MESSSMPATAGPEDASCDATNGNVSMVDDQDGWNTVSKYRGRKSKDKHVARQDGPVLDNNKRNLNNHVNQEDGKKTHQQYGGRKSSDKKNMRRGKGQAAASPPPSSVSPREVTPVPVAAKVPQLPPTEVSQAPPVAKQQPTVSIPKEAVDDVAKVVEKTLLTVVLPNETEHVTPEPQENVVRDASKEAPARSLSPQVTQEPQAAPQVPPPSVVAESTKVAPKTHEASPVPVESAKQATPEPAPPQVNNHAEENHNHEAEEEQQVEEEEDEVRSNKPEMPKYTYKDDQWSPLNQLGKKQYDRSFLLELKDNPLSLKRPDSLPNLEVVLNDGQSPNMNKFIEPRSSMPPMMMHGGADLLPNYFKGTRMNKGKPISGRPSYPGKNAPKVIAHVIRPSTEFNKLQVSENAWRPSKFKDKKFQGDEEVLRKMRGILNKLTPDNFDKLVVSVRELPFATSDARLIEVIKLIFEKAVDEQGFSSTYAKLCEVLSTHDKKKEKNFRFLIISQCQKEFENDTLDELKEAWMAKIELEPNEEKKDELRTNYEYEEMKMRKRSVGNIRFIGELYKMKMLNSSIMMKIIETLIQKSDSESLECLCKLLSTIGSILEGQLQNTPKVNDFNKRFKDMEAIINEKKTSSRVRFLIMDVIDLKKNSWIARREETKPKTKKQVHEDVKREEEREQALNTSYRRDDRGGGGGGGGGGGKRNSRDNRPFTVDNAGWTIPTRPNRGFDTNRLNNFNLSQEGMGKDFQLRTPDFNRWQCGSSGGGSQDHKGVENRFKVLSEDRQERHIPPRFTEKNNLVSFGSKSMPPPSSEKQNALTVVKQFVGQEAGRPSIRSRETSLNREPVSELNGESSMDEDTAKTKTVGLIEEFVSINDFKEAKACVIEVFHSNTISMFVRNAVEWVLDRDSKKRKLVGQLFHDLIKENILLKRNFIEGNEDTIQFIEDYMIDIPQICDYYGEILAPILADNVFTLEQMYEMCLDAQGVKADLFARIIFKATDILSSDALAQLWKASNLNWSNIVPSGTDVQQFLDKHKMNFLTSSAPKLEKKWEVAEVRKEMCVLFKRASNDEIMNWVEANIAKEDHGNAKFIRALVTALIESVVITTNDGASVKLDEQGIDNLKSKLPILLKYVDGEQKLETQCIYELQALSVRYQHPAAFLEGLFHSFYDCDVISDEAFWEWEKHSVPEEQEGKGVCLKSLKGFFSWLKNVDEEVSA